MTETIQEVECALNAWAITVRKVVVLNDSPADFGNWAADFYTEFGHLRVVRDRGQVFIDVVDSSGLIIRGDVVWPALTDVYRGGSWSIDGLIGSIVQSVRGPKGM